MKHFKSVILTTQVTKVKTNKTFKLLFLMQLLSKQLTISLSKVTLLQVNFTNLLEVKQIWQAIRKKVLQVNNLQLQATAISLVTNM